MSTFAREQLDKANERIAALEAHDAEAVKMLNAAEADIKLLTAENGSLRVMLATSQSPVLDRMNMAILERANLADELAAKLDAIHESEYCTVNACPTCALLNSYKDAK